MANRWISMVAAGLAAISWVTEASAQSGIAPNPAGQGAGLAPIPMLDGQNPVSPPINFSQAEEIPTTSRPDHYTPFMLGDLVLPIGSYFLDLKVAEGNSPRPMDRAFLNANYYNNLGRTSLLNPLLKDVDLYRYVFGYEKTFLDGKASVQIRVPFFTVNVQARDIAPDAGFTSTYLGNISLIGKYVLMEDQATGSLLSTGAVITIPTASSRVVDPGPGTLAYVDPFVGYILNRGDFYLQGFTSMILPFARAESIVLFQDLGIGYFLYRNSSGTGFIRSLAPTVETHLTVPLRQADPTVNDFGLFDNIKVTNILDFTAGATIEFTNRSTLGLGACVPVTGPKPWDFEAMAQFNYRF